MKKLFKKTKRTTTSGRKADSPATHGWRVRQRLESKYATPKTDAVEYNSGRVKPERMVVDAEFARDLERWAQDEIRKHHDTIKRGQKIVAERDRLAGENKILCAFINREMGMTATDPRLIELDESIAALSNDGTERTAADK